MSNVLDKQIPRKVQSRAVTVAKVMTTTVDLYWKCPKCEKGVLNFTDVKVEGEDGDTLDEHICDSCGNTEYLKNTIFPQSQGTYPPVVQQSMWDSQMDVFVGQILTNRLGNVFVYVLDTDNQFYLVELNEKLKEGQTPKKISSEILTKKEFEWRKFVPSELGVDQNDLSQILVVDDDKNVRVDFSKVKGFDLVIP